jgi:glycosyltransferase involved in cell wall biosynthesis
MQVLFVHPNFPAQFGPVAMHLAKRADVECYFVSRTARGLHEGIKCIPFELKGGATRTTHYCSRSFENAVWHAHGVYEACKVLPELQPDLVVGHSGFGSTAMLAELFDCPIVNLFEYYYHSRGSDIDFRPDFPPSELDRLRSRMRNAMILVDLETCRAGYTPTHWQKSLFPDTWSGKLEVIHDGIDTELWRRHAGPRTIGQKTIAEQDRIVTYVARGLEAMRGFDIFVRVANRIAERMKNVVFVVVGTDRVHYGGDMRHIEAQTFREHVIRQERPDLDRFHFLGRVPPRELSAILSLSDLHIYLTVPFVLSWSMLNAMACECTVLASDTAPVREVIVDGENGLLADFFDVEALSDRALDVLRRPSRYRELGRNARTLVEERYSTDVVVPKLTGLFERVANDG